MAVRSLSGEVKVCGLVNAKNRSGDYTGAQHFFGTLSRDHLLDQVGLSKFLRRVSNSPLQVSRHGDVLEVRAIASLRRTTIRKSPVGGGLAGALRRLLVGVQDARRCV